MDHDRIAGQLRQPGANRIGALCTALDQLPDVEAGQSLACKLLLAAADDDADAGDCRMRSEGFDSPPKHRLSAQQPVLLGKSAAEPLAFSGSDDECGRCHRAGV